MKAGGGLWSSDLGNGQKIETTTCRRMQAIKA